MISKSATVLAVHASQSIRGTIKQGLSDAGFTNVMTLASLEDAIDFLESNMVDWMIAPVKGGGDINLFQMMGLCMAHKNLFAMKISGICSDLEAPDLAMLFELGMISYFDEVESKQQFGEQLEAFLEVVENTKETPYQLPAHYLRKALVAAENWQYLTNMEEQICQFAPGEPDQILNLGRAYLMAGEFEKGETALAHVQMIDPDKKEEILDIADQYLQGKRKFNINDHSVNHLNLDLVFLIDSEESITESISNVLTELGAKEVRIFDDGVQALNALDEVRDRVSLIIQEWRVRSIPAYVLLQSIREKGLEETPIIVLSSLVSKEDMPLLQEFGANDLVEKPYVRGPFLKRLISALQQDIRPTAPLDIERKVRKLLRAKKVKEAEDMYQSAMKADRLPVGFHHLCAAQISLVKEQYKEAAAHAAKALTLTNAKVIAYTVLGKSLFKLGNFEASVQCFEKAQAMSPKNIERLCLLAEAHREAGDEDKAHTVLNKATAMNGNGSMVQQATLDMGMASENPDDVVEFARNLDSEDDVISLTNNRAVAFVRVGRVDEAVQMYESIVNMLPKPSLSKLVPVNYNLGLALVRQDDFDKAKQYLKRVIKDASKDQAAVVLKAKSLIKRIDHAVETGTGLILNTTGDDKANSEESTASPATKAQAAAANADDVVDDLANEQTDDFNPEMTLAAIEAQPGESGLFGIYMFPDWTDSRTQEVRTLPHYNQRGAIERDESFSVERSA